uniref:Chemosensory protein 9 n=1 Tax=Chrysopa pallens TaxID=417485 RepID=A0A0R8PDI8_CHRPA|nr:chemosensory protein 9 [Chrysopa pallens]
MKFAVVFVVVSLAISVYSEETYPTKYDNIDIDSILNNDRLLNNYIACIEGTGKCTTEGDELKKYFTDAIQTCCSKCSQKQKEGVKKVVLFMEKNKPDKIKELRAKFDPEGVKDKECRKKYNL